MDYFSLHLQVMLLENYGLLEYYNDNHFFILTGKEKKAMTELLITLMERDDLTENEAQTAIDDARETLIGYLDEMDFESAMYICEEFFGLEPDYLMDLM